jgi:N-acetylneuraminic acid mutarotase
MYVGRRFLPIVLLSSSFACQPEVSTSPDAETPSFAVTTGYWLARRAMPEGTILHVATSVTNTSGKTTTYVLGGFSYSLRELRRNDAYDPATNTWTGRASMPARRRDMNGAATLGGKIYTSGGYNSLGRSVNTLWVYDPATNTWAIKAPLPNPVAGGSTAALGGKLYVLYNDCYDCPYSNISNRMWRYDPATNTWKRMPGSPHHHAGNVGGVINGKWYLAGNYERWLDVYDPVTNTWTSKTRRPVAGGVGRVAGGKLYIFGAGLDNRTLVYNPATDRWGTAAPMPTRRGFATAVVTTRSGVNRILVLGGQNDSDNDLATNEEFTP